MDQYLSLTDRNSSTHGTGNQGNGNGNDSTTKKTNTDGTTERRADGSVGDPSTPEGLMLREVQDSYNALRGTIRGLANGASDVLSQFPSAESLFSGGLFSGAQVEQTAAALGDRSATTAGDRGARGDRTAGGAQNGFGDTSHWMADTFNQYLGQPMRDMLGPALGDFANGSLDWGTMFASADTSRLNRGNATEQSALRRNGPTDRIQGGSAGRNNPGRLQLPEGATQSGSVSVNGRNLEVWQSADKKDTFLKDGDKVVAQQRGDGSYGMRLPDGSELNARLSKGEDGKYHLDQMVRRDGDRTLQRFEKGVHYNHNHDRDGRPASIDAAADLRHLNQEQLNERLATVRKEMGGNGSALLRTQNENGEAERLLMQNHGENTYSVTNVDRGTAQVFHNGQQYRLNGDQLQSQGQDGSWQNVEPSAPEAQRLTGLIQQVNSRAAGQGEVEGVRLGTTGGGGARVSRVDQTTGEIQSETTVPREGGLQLVNNQRGETTSVDGERVQTTDSQGRQLWNMDPDKGLSTPDFNVNPDSGITDSNTGDTLVGPDKDFRALLDDGDKDFQDQMDLAKNRQDNSEASSDVTRARIASATVTALTVAANNLMSGGDPANIAAAQAEASDGIAVASAAMTNFTSNPDSVDFKMQMALGNVLNGAENALDRANRQQATTSIAESSGMAGKTDVARLNRLSGSTIFAPDEVVQNLSVA